MLFTSELANQDAQKALFPFVVHTNLGSYIYSLKFAKKEVAHLIVAVRDVDVLVGV